MDLSIASKSQTKKISRGLHKIDSTRKSDENTKHLLKYFLKHHDNLKVSITSGPAITKLKRLKVLRNFNGFLDKAYPKNLGFALIKNQSKLLTRFPLIDKSHSTKEARYAEATPADMTRYFPLFTKLQYLSIDVSGSKDKKIHFSKKTLAYLPLLKNTLKRLSLIVLNQPGPIAEISKLANEIWKHKEILEKLEDFVINMSTQGKENPWELVFKGHPILKYLTYLRLSHLRDQLNLESFNLLVKDCPNLKGLTSWIKTQEVPQEKMNLDLLKRLENLRITIDSDFALFTKIFTLPASLQSLSLQLSFRGPQLLETGSLDAFHSQWEKLNQLQSFKLEFPADDPPFPIFQQVFGPALEKIPRLVSLHFPLAPANSPGELIKVASFLTPKVTENLGLTLRNLSLDLEELEMTQDEDSEIFKAFENLSSLTINTKDLGISLAASILHGVKRNFPVEIQLEKIQITSWEQGQAFFSMIQTLTKKGNISRNSKISIMVRVLLKAEIEYQQVFEEYCKVMSLTESLKGVDIKFVFRNYLKIEELKSIVALYPNCRRFSVQLSKNSMEYMFENGALIASKTNWSNLFG